MGGSCDKNLENMVRGKIANEFLELMNELIQIDPSAVNSLIDYRIKCSDKLADHPMVTATMDAEIGLLGILNAAVSCILTPQIRLAISDDSSFRYLSVATPEEVAEHAKRYKVVFGEFVGERGEQ